MPTSALCRAVRFHEYGDPCKVLRLDTVLVDITLAENEVLVRWIAAPVNHVDMEQISGAPGPWRPLSGSPRVAGTEAVGVVEKVGSEVHGFYPNDHVVSISPDGQVLTEFSKVLATELIKVRKGIDIVCAATMVVNPLTCWTILSEYVPLKAGDYVLQTSADSYFGKTLIQIAKALSLRTINIIADGKNAESTRADLKSLGATHVFTDSELLNETEALQTLIRRPLKLAVCGAASRASVEGVANLLVRNAVFVSCNESDARELSSRLCKFPVLVRDFQLSEYLMEPANSAKARANLERIQDLMITAQLRPLKAELRPLHAFSAAVARHCAGSQPKQIIIVDRNEFKRARL